MLLQRLFIKRGYRLTDDLNSPKDVVQAAALAANYFLLQPLLRAAFEEDETVLVFIQNVAGFGQQLG